MGFRFYKRVRLFKGLSINLSKSGTSVSIGGRGATLNLRKGRITGTLGIPGTGISYRESYSTDQADDHVSDDASPEAVQPASWFSKFFSFLASLFFWMVLLVVVGFAITSLAQMFNTASVGH